MLGALTVTVGVAASFASTDPSHDAVAASAGRPARGQTNEVSPASWMSALDGSVKLSQLSIPGTHDSAARVENWPGTARCQSLSLPEQLQAGVRYLDIRCRHLRDGFSICHGTVDQKLPFSEVLAQVYGFLETNRGECVLMVVKEEHTAEGNTRSFEATFDASVAGNPGRWWLGTSLPTLEEVRGKIVLVRRFGAAAAKGINATAWGDNTSFNVNNLAVEDHYVVDNNDTKWGQVTAALDAAAADGNAAVLHLTHSSGYRSGTFGIPSIPWVSDTLNPRLHSWFTKAKPGHYGCVIMDFADRTRPWRIAQSNFQDGGQGTDRLNRK
jgi:1-phosphatidylinositol phosphodiesterase